MPKEELTDLLAMKHVEQHSKYLGISTLPGCSKKLVFNAVKDRIWKKLHEWKEKFLSRTGKEVLLKSVIQAISNYLMGVYKFPVCHYASHPLCYGTFLVRVQRWSVIDALEELGSPLFT